MHFFAAEDALELALCAQMLLWRLVIGLHLGGDRAPAVAWVVTRREGQILLHTVSDLDTASVQRGCRLLLQVASDLDAVVARRGQRCQPTVDHCPLEHDLDLPHKLFVFRDCGGEEGRLPPLVLRGGSDLTDDM